MFTASLQSFARNKLRIFANVVFSDGVEQIARSYEFPVGTSTTQMKRVVKADLDALNIALPNVPQGDIDFTGLNPEPTAEETTRNTWLTAYRRLGSIDRLVKLGVLTGNEAAVTNLRSSVASGFIQSYVDHI